MPKYKYSANPKKPTLKRTSLNCPWVDPEPVTDTVQTPKYPEPVKGFKETKSITSRSLVSLIPSEEWEIKIDWYKLKSKNGFIRDLI